MSKSSVALLALSFTLLAAAGCKKEPENNEGPMESAGEEVDEATENAGDAVEEAGDNVEDAADDATD